MRADGIERGKLRLKRGQNGARALPFAQARRFVLFHL